MNSRVSLFSRYFSHLLNTAIACGAGGFAVSTAAAEFGFPVFAQISFYIGLIAMLVLVVTGIAGLIGITVERLRRLARSQ